MNQNEAFILAAKTGDITVVERLLQDLRVDPSAHNNFAIWMAACGGHLKVVERLLQDLRVDPSARDNYAILLAAENGHLAVVERLLQDKRVDPSAENNYAIRLAAYNGHIKVVERLLQDERVDPLNYNNYTVRLAAKNGHIKIVDRLFRVPSFYSTVDLPADLIKHIGMIQGRCIDVCNGLQDLGLPALLTLGILDELIPNEIRMWAKWELVTAVKHFHERQEKKQSEKMMILETK
jgi:hypothetical protein